MGLGSRLFGAVVGLLLFVGPNASHNSVRPSWSVYVQGMDQSVTIHALASDEHLWIPVRSVVEALGGQVEWLPPSEVLVTFQETYMLSLDSPTLIGFGRSVDLGARPHLVEGRVYAPLSMLADGLGVSVVVDGTAIYIAKTETRSTGYLASQATPNAPTGGSVVLEPGKQYIEVDGECHGGMPTAFGQDYVPVRLFADAVNGTVETDDTSATIRLQSHTFSVMRGQRLAMVDGRIRAMAGPVLFAVGQLWAPAGDLVQALGLDTAVDRDRSTTLVRSGRKSAGTGSTCNPRVPLASYIVMDRATSAVIAENKADSQQYVASTTKILTAVMAIEQGKLDAKVPISQNAASQECTCMSLEPGQRWTLRDLLGGLITVSGNDAATAIAEYLSGTEPAFGEAMTRRARQLGARHSKFVTASGLDDYGNPVSTARDLALITRYALQNQTFRSIVVAKAVTVSGPEGPRRLVNKNNFVQNYPGATGVKNGYTEKSGYTLVVSAQRGTTELIVVLLGASTRAQVFDQANVLMDYGFDLASKSWALQVASR